MSASSRKCLICSVPIKECRLGIDCCRACSVFYKRVRASKRIPNECVTGEGNCVEKGTIVACRKCRYDLFLEVLKNAESADSDNVSTTERKASQDFLRLVELRRTQFIDHKTFSLDQPSCSFTPILDRIRRSYSLMCLTRKSGENGTKPLSSRLHQRDHEGTKITFTHSTLSMTVANRRIFDSALNDFARMAFPDFSLLDTSNQELCIASCTELVNNIESAYRENHYFPEDLSTYFDGYTTIVTNESIPFLLKDCEELDQNEVEALENNLKCKPRNREEYTRVNPDDVEFIALLGLAFWNDQVAQVNEDLSPIVQKNRSAILKEMHDVYNVRGQIEYESRLGELLALLENMKKNHSSTSKSESLLLRIGKSYNASIDRRRTQEDKLLICIEDRRIAPHPTEKLFLADENTPTQTFHICYAETLTFFSEAFPSLKRLKEEEQEALFKGYIHKFGFLDMHYRTRQIWGEIKQYIMGSVLTVVNVEDTNHYLSEDEGGEHRQMLHESARTYLSRQIDIIIPIFCKAQITSTEFHALLAFILCEIDSSCDVPIHIVSALEELHSKVMHDLQQYYKKELGLDDFSMRLGNLMTICHCIQECVSLFNEYFRMHTTVFDQYKTEDMLKELFL